MAEFQTKEILKPLIDFINSCPFLEQYFIEFGNMSTQRFENESDIRPQSAIEYSGSDIIQKKKDIAGIIYVKRQANFQLYLLRKSNDNDYRSEITEFAFNFERWVDYQQSKGETPKIGDFPDDEEIWASNGMFYDDVETSASSQEVSVYLIQIHIQYIEKSTECCPQYIKITPQCASCEFYEHCDRY